MLDADWLGAPKLSTLRTTQGTLVRKGTQRYTAKTAYLCIIGAQLRTLCTIFWIYLCILV